jgi:hypothetical protein
MAQQQFATPAPAMDWQSQPLPVRARRSGMRGAAQAFPMQQVPGTHIGGTAHQGQDSLRPQQRSMLGEFDRHTAPRAQLASHGPTLTSRRGPVGEGSLGAAPRGMIQTTPLALAPAALPQTEFRATNRARLAAAFEALRTGETGRQGPLAVGQNPAPERDGPVHRVADFFAAAMGQHARGQRIAPQQHTDAVEGLRQDPNRADTAVNDGFKPAAVASVTAPAVFTYTPTVLSGRGEETENIPVVQTTGRGGPGTVSAASITPALTSSFRSDQ